MISSRETSSAPRSWTAWLWLLPLALLAGFWAAPRLLHSPAPAEEEKPAEAVAAEGAAEPEVIKKGKAVEEGEEAEGAAPAKKEAAKKEK